MAALTKYFPLALIMLLVILVMLFGNFRQPLIIFLILPLSLIGMVFGLWVTGFQFGFFCIAGWLGLLGMIIKNVIVLIDEVNIQQKAGVGALYGCDRGYGFQSPSGIDGGSDHGVRKHPVVVRHCVWRDGGYHCVRTFLCHPSDTVCHSGPVHGFL